MPVLLRGVDRQQLHVAGFVEPAMRDHSLTGLCVHMLFAEAPEPVEVLLGQSLSLTCLTAQRQSASYQG